MSLDPLDMIAEAESMTGLDRDLKEVYIKLGLEIISAIKDLENDKYTMVIQEDGQWDTTPKNR